MSTFGRMRGRDVAHSNLGDTSNVMFGSDAETAIPIIEQEAQTKDETPLLLTIPHRMSMDVMSNPVFEMEPENKNSVSNITFAFRMTSPSFQKKSSEEVEELRKRGLARKFVEMIRGNTNVTLFLTILAVIVGCISVSIEIGVQYLHELHIYLGQITSIWVVNLLIWSVYLLVWVFAVILAVLKIAPTAAGSGLPEMKSILSGVVIHQYLSFRTFLVKVLGLTTVIGAGLLVGKDGPFAHLSAALADTLMKIPFVFERLRLTEALRQQVLCAAMAAGVAATFGSPIGGILYSIEVTSTYFPFRNYWYSAYTGFIADLVFRLVNASRLGVPLFRAVMQINYDSAVVLSDLNGFDLLIALGLGVAGALFGALFTKTHMMIVYIRRLGIKSGFYLLKTPYLYGFCVCILTSIMLFPDLVGDFMALRGASALSSLFYPGPMVFPNVASHDWYDNNLYWNLVIFGLSRYILVVLTISIPIPCGFLLPVYGAGAALGRIMGEWVGHDLSRKPHIPSIYALIGAGSLGAGVTHNYSTVIILLEMTGQMVPLLPLLVGVITSIFISRQIGFHIFDGIIISRKLPYLPDINNDEAFFLTSMDIARTDIIENRTFVTMFTSHAELTRVVKDKAYKCDQFAVVEMVEGLPMLRGAVDRSLLERYLEASTELAEQVQVPYDPRHGPSDEPDDHQRPILSDDHPHHHHSMSEIKDSVTSFMRKAISQSNDLGVSDIEMDTNSVIHVPFEPCIIELHPTTTMDKVHQLFIALHLRSAFISDKSQLLGVISRTRLRTFLTPSLFFWELDPTTPLQ